MSPQQWCFRVAFFSHNGFLAPLFHGYQIQILPRILTHCRKWSTTPQLRPESYVVESQIEYGPTIFEQLWATMLKALGSRQTKLINLHLLCSYYTSRQSNYSSTDAFKCEQIEAVWLVIMFYNST